MAQGRLKPLAMMRGLNRFALIALFVSALCASCVSPMRSTASMESHAIWEAAPHNAFTDLIEWRGRLYCAFREASTHMSRDGVLRLIESRDDGETWRSVFSFSTQGHDLRDASLTMMPDGRLLMSSGRAIPKGEGWGIETLAWLTADGTHFSDAVRIGQEGEWLWRVQENGGRLWSLSYGLGRVALLATDGTSLDFQPVVDPLLMKNRPSEGGLLWRHDGTVAAVVRRDGDDPLAQVGVADSPAGGWSWQTANLRFDSPVLGETRDGRIWAVGRLRNPERCSFCWVDLETGILTEALRLPSSGDSAYPGVVVRGSELLVSYYSSHEDKTKIYLARFQLPEKK